MLADPYAAETLTIVVETVARLEKLLGVAVECGFLDQRQEIEEVLRENVEPLMWIAIVTEGELVIHVADWLLR